MGKCPSVSCAGSNHTEAADQTIVVTAGAISSVAATSATPKNPQYREIDLRSLKVLPGLIDVHPHDDGYEFRARHSLGDAGGRRFVAKSNAKKVIAARVKIALGTDAAVVMKSGVVYKCEAD